MVPFGIRQAIGGLPFDNAQDMFFLNRPEASDIQRACGPIDPWELLFTNRIAEGSKNGRDLITPIAIFRLARLLIRA